MRRRKIGLAVVVALAVTVAGGLYLLKSRNDRQIEHHKQLLFRIDAHLKAATGSLPPVKAMEPWTRSERWRFEILRSVNTALWNWPLSDRRGTVPEKVAALADRLDATNGPDLKTFEGCVELLRLCDEASWTFYDYPWITRLYEMEAEEAVGTSPKLPVLGKRWENDERRKKWDSRWPAKK